MTKKWILAALLGLTLQTADAQRVTDKLNRGIVALPAQSGGGNFVSWRIFGEEYYDTEYNLYRDGTKVAGPLKVSNYQDKGGSSTSMYQVEAVVRGVVQEKSAEVKAWSQTYLDVKVQPVVNRAGKTIGNSVAGNSGGQDTTTPGYTLNDVSLADVDGDGVAELIVKRNNSQGNILNADNKTDFNLYECYKLDGTRLWWIDLGPNLMAGPDEQWDLIGYDWDGDGKAECVMRGADNMIIHTATGKTINIGNMNYYAPRDEYTHQGAEYLLYLNGATGEPYGWDGESEGFTPMAYPLPRFETGESDYAAVWGQSDTGHRSSKHYFGAPYLDGRHPSIFLGRGCYTRHKACALDVNPDTHELTQRWRWDCYTSGSPWFGNGFHNFSIADVDMDGRDEIVYGSMILDDTGYGLCSTGLGHGDAQHCGDLDPYRWGLEQFTCLEGSQGNAYWGASSGNIYYRKSDGGDDGRALAGNFTDEVPGGQGRSVSSGVIGLSSDKVVYPNGDTMSGNYANLNNRIYWDGDLLDEIFNSKNGANRDGHIFKWGGSVITTFSGAVSNNWTKCNPSAQGDILGDWREELVLRTADNSALRVFSTNYTTTHAIYTLWHDHQYRNAMAWQCVGYNQPPHTSYFLGNLERITVAPPPLTLNGRTEVEDGGTVGTTSDHLLISGYADKTITVTDGASPYILTVNTPAWVKGSGGTLNAATGHIVATAATPKQPQQTVETYTTTLKGGAFAGSMRLVKQGEGRLVLPNVVEKHTGETSVWNGTLEFDGTMEASPVWMNRHTTLVSNGGCFMGGLKIDYNATVLPGGNGQVGSITVSDLTLGFGSRIVFDVADGGSIDQVNAATLTVETKAWQNGPKYKTPIFEFRNVGNLPDGQHLIGEVGTVTGSVDNILVEGISGKRFELKHEDGKLYLVLITMRDPATVVWNGTATKNVWDLAQSKNFLNGTDEDFAVAGDDIIFNDEAASGNVVIKGAVQPKSITFNNEKLAYKLTGDSILGGAPITKNGKGNVTISTENRTGATTLNGGKLTVNALANNTGVAYGALGNVSQPININDGATLSFSAPVITDQQVNVSGEALIEVPANTAVTFNKGFKGTGATVVKTGTGTLTTGTSGTYTRLIIRQGTVNCVSLNNTDQLPSTVEFQGGTLWGTTMDNTPGRTVNAAFEVPEGKTGTFYGPYRGNVNGKLTGKGTMNVYSGGVRCYWKGDWSQFEGTIVPGTYQRQAKPAYTPTFNITNAKGMGKATLKLNEGVTVINEDPANGTAYNVEVGYITGTGTLAGKGKYIIGTTDRDIIVNFSSTAPIVKRGTGYLQITTVGKINAPLTVEEGELRINDTKQETSILGSGLLTVGKAGRVTGRAMLSSLTMESGAQLDLHYIYGETTPGTMKISGTANIKRDAVVTFLIRDAKSCSTLTPSSLTMNGRVRVTLADSYAPKVGDEFILWTVTNTFNGLPDTELPELPAGMAWDTTQLAAKKGVLRIVTADAISGMTAQTTAKCHVFTLNGVAVATLNVPINASSDALRQAGLPAGAYVVRTTDGQRTSVRTVIIR